LLYEYLLRASPAFASFASFSIDKLELFFFAPPENIFRVYQGKGGLEEVATGGNRFSRDKRTNYFERLYIFV
jgi:hypothetical protein